MSLILNNRQGFLKCISESLKLWAEDEEKPDYDKIMRHIDVLVRGDKKGLREKIETCVTSSSTGSFNDRLHDAYKCFWTSTKGLGRQQTALLEQLNLQKFELNKKI